MHGLMSLFVEDEAAWLKGPYVQVGLPFVPGTRLAEMANAPESPFRFADLSERNGSRASIESPKKDRLTL
jgi:DEAD/DEAH box helicase domain-containing protein